MRAHTATHLLHAQLTKLFPETRQAGSLVDEDYLRFDFVADHFLTDQQVIDLEHTINDYIADDYLVQTQILSKEDALKSWAKAFFQDKYGDEVRVVTISNEDQNIVISRELCGGTHVDRTGDVGIFKITSQQAVSSGIKRIIAYTGTKVYDYITELEKERVWFAQILDCNPKQIGERLQKLSKEYLSIQANYQSLLDLLLGHVLDICRKDARVIHEATCVIVDCATHFPSISLMQLTPQCIKYLTPWEMIICIDQQGSYSIISADHRAKKLLQLLWLKGGGNDTLVQGKDAKILQLLSS